MAIRYDKTKFDYAKQDVNSMSRNVHVAYSESLKKVIVPNDFIYRDMINNLSRIMETILSEVQGFAGLLNYCENSILEVDEEVELEELDLASSSEVVVGETFDVNEILDKLPDDLSIERKELIESALSLVGKVPYFYGAKTYYPGWNKKWGKDQKVVHAGSPSSGQEKPYGLDCSGFVLWSFVTMGEKNDISRLNYLNNMGEGTNSQWNTSISIDEEESILPGDLVFKAHPNDCGINHIGIVVGKNDKGENIVVHCSSSATMIDGSIGGVVVTTVDDAGLSCYRRPPVYSEEEKIAIETLTD